MVRRWLWDREVSGSNPAPTIGIFLSKKFIPYLLLFTQVYKWVPVREVSQCEFAKENWSNDLLPLKSVVDQINSYNSIEVYIRIMFHIFSFKA